MFLCIGILNDDNHHTNKTEMCVRVQITSVSMRKVRKIEIWFFREKVFITICRVIENIAKVD